MGGFSDQPGEITKLLHQWREGNAASERQLFEIVMPNLKKLAHYLMTRERKDHPLQATELVSEAYLRLVAAKDRDWQSRKHFFAIAARIMRRHLIDMGRMPKPEFIAVAPGGDLPHPLPFPPAPLDAIALDRCLDSLARVQPDWCTVVEMKICFRFTDTEAAEAMGVPSRTLQRMWLEARKSLHACMETGDAQSPGR
jgi:RNA polymerase sigma factor (TIGR02999 family)